MGDSTKLWMEAVGRNITDFEELAKMFVERYWGPERHAEVIRKLYTPGTFNNQNRSREQYLLEVCTENRYLDTPLNEKNLVGAVSRQLGTDIARHTIASNIVTVKDLAKLLNSWEEMDRDPVVKERSERRGDNNGGPGQYGNNWRGGPGRRWEYERRQNGPELTRDDGGKGRREEGIQGMSGVRNGLDTSNKRNQNWTNQGRVNGKTEELN